MTKKIVITKCYQCPHKRYFEGWGTFCRHKSIGTTVKEINNIDALPEWCPLEDN